MLNSLLQIHLKLLQKKRFKKTAEPTGDLIGNKIVHRITKIQKTTPKNNSEINEEILRERFIPHKIINYLRLEEENY